jgi:hypothetical protein
MGKTDDMFNLDVIDFFAESGFYVDLSFTVAGKLLQTECTITLYDPKRSLIGIRPIKAENETWIIPIRNIELLISKAL